MIYCLFLSQSMNGKNLDAIFVCVGGGGLLSGSFKLDLLWTTLSISAYLSPAFYATPQE